MFDLAVFFFYHFFSSLLLPLAHDLNGFCYLIHSLFWKHVFDVDPFELIFVAVLPEEILYFVSPTTTSQSPESLYLVSLDVEKDNVDVDGPQKA